ncbi:MAG: NTP transferase domain-containing protein [Aureispira sp.]|nr:NTP transferase domain-containing protein [Aureispira sp.]
MIAKSALTGVILAGGQSRRMGTNKALMNYNGKPFIEHILEALKPVVSQIIIIGKQTDYGYLGLAVHPDIIEDAGPVGGIYTVLSHSNTPYNLVLSCDIPSIQTEVLSFLVQNSSTQAINTLSLKGRAQPITAIYHKKCLPTFKQALDAQRLRLSDLLVPLNAHLIDCPKHLESCLANINTIRDLENLENQFMEVTIKYFGLISEALEKEQEVMNLQQNSTAKTLREELENQYPKLKDKNYQIAINQAIANTETSISLGDEIALLPPFAGG